MAVNLSAGELLRPEKLWTRDMFLTKFKNKDPFKLHNKGLKVVLQNPKESIKALELAFKGRGDSKALNSMIFMDTKGNIYQGTGRFEKTVEFGGGGSTGSTKTTAVTESAQCVYNVAYVIGNGANYKFTVEHLEEAFKSSKVDITGTKFSQIKNLPDTWKISSEVTAKELRKQLPRYFGPSYEHHRGSKLVQEIEKQFWTINGEISPKQFGELNKWSPADIWIIHSGYKRKFIKELKETTSFTEINRLLGEGIKNHQLIGISLKQVGKTATTKWQNWKAGGWTPPKYTVEKLSVGKRDFISSMQGHIIYDGGEMTLRNVTRATGFNGEIEGKKARHGKISGAAGPKSAMGIYMKKYLGENISRETDVLSDRLNSTDTYKKFWEMYKKTEDKTFTDEMSFITAVSKQDIAWYVSKYKATEVISILKQGKKEDVNHFVTACLSYASSQTENSAPFFKIY